MSFANSKFYKLLTPKLKIKLTLTCLDSLHKKFYFFFNDITTGMSADQSLITKILINMFSCLYFPGEPIVKPGQFFENLCFVQKGKVLVVDLFHRFYISHLPSGSYFGDS